MPGSVEEIVGCAVDLAAAGLLSFGLPAINSEIPPRRLASAADTYGTGLGGVGAGIPVSTTHGVSGMAAASRPGGDGRKRRLCGVYAPPVGLTNTPIRNLLTGVLIGVALLVVWLALHSVGAVQID